MGRKKKEVTEDSTEIISIRRDGRTVQIPAEKLHDFENVGWKKVKGDYDDRRN